MMKLSDLTANVILLQGSKRFPSPRWLQGSCGLLLSKALLQDNGFVAVVTAVMENFEAEVNICTRADLVAKIVTRLPQASASKEKYCRNICHQILKLLFCDAMFGKRKDVVIVSLCHAVVATTFSFYVKLTTFCDRFLVTSLFKPFDDCCDNQAKPGSEAGATDGRDGVRVSLTQAVEALHRLVVLYKHNDQDDFVRRRLHSRLHLLFRLYTWTRKTASCHLTALLRDVIVRCLVAFPRKRQAAECLLTLANVKTAAGAGEWKRARATLRFRFQDTEPVAFDLCGAEKLSPEDVIAAQDDVTDSVISIMEAGSGLGFESDCLVVLLETLFDDEEEDDEEEPSRGGRLEPDDERAARFLARGESRLVTVALISYMCDNIPPDQLLGNDAGKTSRFLQVVLESYAKSAISDSDDGDERIRLVFAIVALCLVPADYQTLKPLLPPLQKIAAKCASSEIGEIAADLALAIMTTSSPDDLSIFSDFMQKQARVMGTSPSTTSSMTQQTPKMVANKSDPIPDLTSSPDRRKEQQPSSPKFNTDHDNTVNSARGCDSSPVSPPAGAVEQTSDDSFADKCMEEAIDGIYDPSPPIRAAAIRRLRDLVHRRHPPALAGAARLLDVMMTSLRNEQDPFVYLSSVRCVSEIAQVAGAGAAQTRSFLDQLVDEFAKSLEREEDNDAVVAKLGEVLVRVVTQLGDTTACASRRLLPVLLSGSAGHRPAHVRTTCVSLLADLLPALRHQVHSMQFEITECLCGIASGERDVEVRRAAVHAIRTIVECLGSDLIQALPDVMRRWYATCKRCYSRDDDNRVQLHAQLALESLDATMRDQLLPDRAPPSKKIVVLPT